MVAAFRYFQQHKVLTKPKRLERRRKIVMYMLLFYFQEFVSVIFPYERNQCQFMISFYLFLQEKNCRFYNSRNGCRYGGKCKFRHTEDTVSTGNRSTSNDTHTEDTHSEDTQKGDTHTNKKTEDTHTNKRTEDTQKGDTHTNKKTEDTQKGDTHTNKKTQ